MRKPLCLLCLTFVVMLAICMQFVPMPAPDYDGLDGQKLAVQGQVYRKEYKERSGSCQIPVIYLKSVHILNGFGEESDEFWKNHFQQFPNYEMKNIICYIEEYGEELPLIGETICVSGQVRSFLRAGNPGEFDMSEYYRVMQLEFALENTCITAVGGEEKVLEEGLYRLKQYFAKVLEHIFPQKEASIMKAMLLGDKNGLDEEIKELYEKSSIIHILSISGLHISVIGMGIYRLFRKVGMPLTVSAVLSIILIYCYGLMTGMSMSAVRAIFMFCLHLVADMVGRTYDMMTALSLAAVLLLIEQPRYVQYSGFLFSFGAVAAIGILLPVLYDGTSDRKYNKRKKKMQKVIRSIKQSIASGIAVTLATVPVHLMFYYQFPVYSILLNLAVIPLMTIVMFAGLLVLLTGGWFIWLAKGAAYADRLILWFCELCCLLGSRIPGGVIISGKPEKWQVTIYLFLLAVLVLQDKMRKEKMPGFWKYQWILVALSILFFQMESGVQVTMLDVGQGDCIHIQSEEGKHYLIDGGSSTKNKVFEYQILPYLKSEGVSHLDAVFVTHSDIDHCSGIINLLERYPADGISVGSLILPDIALRSKDAQYQEIECLAGKKEIAVQYMSRGQRIKDGEMLIDCIHPYKAYETETANEYSLVLLLTYGEFKALFTGDVEGVGEDAAWKYIQEKWNWENERMAGGQRLSFLKVAHHGSMYSTSEGMLKELLPRISVISCGEDNVYGHPHDELLGRLQQVQSRIYSTPKQGAVTVRTDGERVWIETFK